MAQRLLDSVKSALVSDMADAHDMEVCAGSTPTSQRKENSCTEQIALAVASLLATTISASV